MVKRPSGFWPETITNGLCSLGGEAWLVDLYIWIEANVLLSAHELAESPHERRPYYVRTVRGIASDMSDSGHLVRVRPGLYRLP